MKQASILSYSLSAGIFVPVTVEVTIRPGLPGIELTGNVGKDIQEGVNRLSSSIRAAGYSWPKGKISICVSPPTQKKDGAMLDLPIATAILKADGQVILNQEIVVLGEVGLTGKVLAFKQVDLLTRTCSEEGARYLIPESMLGSFRPQYGGDVCTIASLTDLRNKLLPVASQEVEDASWSTKDFLIDNVIGQAHAKRALHIAMAGSIPLLFTGPSGVGKTMLGMAAAQLLGPLSHEERQGQSDAYAKLGQSLPKLGMRTVIQPPTHLSAPLLFSKYAALAQTGVLFLDELPERGKDVVDSLRQFLETPEPGGKYRNKVIAAQNTCFCGRYSDATGSCTCTAADLAKYQRTFSEAVYQRFPLSCFLEKETAPGNYLSGKDMRESIMRMQLGNLVVPVETPQFLEEVSQKEHFSLRTQRNLVRVATTIAGVEGRSSASNEDITEALTFMYKPHNL